ncbi:hypothetical protein H2200_009852 [Cladophialophora chaetospira]|uniref:Uncharacterized protein n=1 Tax=Cladophialophora chaetospira TaxID=386627 RepID=A0AA38X377_9EURO|nr:hypothetical protein H2200_009852 [Cladophialophora chaetospira]
MPAKLTTNPSRDTTKIYRISTRASPKTQHVESSRPASLQEPSSVQDRIRQWQAQGAADALDPDAVSVRSIPISESPSTKTRPKSEYGDGLKVRVGRKPKDTNEDKEEKDRSKSTPRRRIISDGRWKTQKDTKEKVSKPVMSGRSESRKYDPSYTLNEEKPKDRRRSRTQQRSAPEEVPAPVAPFDDGIRVRAMENQGVLPTDDPPPIYDLESAADDELARNLTTGSLFSGDFERQSERSYQPDEDDPSNWKPSRYAELLGRGADADQDGNQSKARRGGLLGKTRDMFTKAENVPHISNRVTSIEAWLEEQPDPFVDDGGRVEDLPPVEVPKPLRKRTERKRSSEVKPIVADPNQIWDSISPSNELAVPKTTRRRDSQQSPDSMHGSTPKLRTPRSTDQDAHDGSPSILRRRGARVRRQRDTTGRDTAASAEPPETVMNASADLQTEAPSIAAPISPPRQCPPTGVHRLTTIASVETFTQTKPEPPPAEQRTEIRPGLKRKLTSHDDLMSVLSMPRGSRNGRSARTARGSRAKHHSASSQELLTSMIADEQKYGRELQTLVDGVIPVLLQVGLSKTDSTAAAALFMSSTAGSDGMSMTKPIIDMGIALERLKTLHKRIPLDNVDTLLNWARSSEKAYRDYLQAWRLGFEDVVVNLAPGHSSVASEDMPKDDSGDLIDGEGKKVDVAYLLKRPLVRVKVLGKAFSQIRDQSDSSLATQMADTYADLTALARRRNQEEQARLEDQIAANIDATRIRDIRTMGATTRVSVNNTRRVKARDFFNLTVYHSSGQRLDCGVELVFRDNAPGEPVGGDILICEVDDASKWLLFAPIELNCISARRGEDGFDLVIMVRGRAGLGKEWHELLALKTDDKEAVTEWMSMLGSNPLPPRLNRTPDFVPPPTPLAITAGSEIHPSKSETGGHTSDKAHRTASQDVPIGEPSVLGAHSEASRHSEPSPRSSHRGPAGLSLGGGLASKPVQYHHIPATLPRKPVPSVVSSDRSTISGQSIKDTATVFTTSSANTASTKLGNVSGQTRHEKSQAQPLFPPTSQHVKNHVHSINDRGGSDPRKSQDYSNRWKSSSTSQLPQPPPATPPQKSHSSQSQTTSVSPSPKTATEAPSQRPAYHRAVSSTPSRELPTVNKIRAQPSETTPSPTHTVRHSAETQSPSPKEEHRIAQSKSGERRPPKSKIYTEDIPAPPAHSQRQERPLRLSVGASSSPPATPPHRSGVLQPVSNNKPSPVLKPTPSPSDKTVRRRTSSPLKHEYAPSTTSGSSSDYDSQSDSDSSSDTSEDLVSEHGDVPTPLVAITGGDRRASKPAAPPTMPPSSYQSSKTSTGTRTLAPSDSASQGPYRKVPASTTVPPNKKSRTIALICSWSDRGMWEQIFPDECSVIISPGLIEAFQMSAAHSDPQNRGADNFDSRSPSLSQQPLVAFELTPVVPLRRGTALDISIRSPPTANSKIRTTNNVMFRSRNPEECEALYGMINWARCNNPTYIQLQSARPARQPSVTFNVGQAQSGRAKSTSWFSFGSQKQSSYRASSAPTPASVDMSVESYGTTTSAFSAFKRFSVSNAFNLNRSSVLRKDGGGGTAGSLYSSSSGTRTGSGSSTPAPSQAGFIPGKDGPNVPSTSAAAAEGGGMVNNMKIRLYVRKGQGWENLGAARLTVLPASPPQSGCTTPKQQGTSSPGTALPAHSRSPSLLTPAATRGPRLPSSSHTPHRVHNNGREKRIVITRNKDREAILLDEVLGESCFERVMQTGIAVKVWSEEERVLDRGGVLLGRERVYMLQFPGSREAGWVFGLVGMYRYGIGE